VHLFEKTGVKVYLTDLLARGGGAGPVNLPIPAQARRP